MIRVLHLGLSHQFGGIESFLLNLNRAIDRSWLHFDYVAYGSTAPREDEFAELGGVIYHLSNRRNPFAYIHELLTLMGSGYDVVHVHKNSAADAIPFLCARCVPGLKVVAHAHNTSSGAGRAATVLNAAGRRVVVRNADVLLACSGVAARWLYGEAAGHATFVPNGIDVSTFAFDPIVRKRVRGDLDVGGDVVVGCVGRFRKEKNQTFLAGVLKELLAKGVSARVLFLGDGSELETTRNTFEEEGLGDRAIFLGSVRNVADYLQAMDVLAMPSLFEGLPLTAVEGQAAGLPVLLSDRITDEVCLTELAVRLPIAGDAAGRWAECIMNSQYGGNRAMIDTKALKTFDASNTATKVQRVYTELVGRRA